MTSASHAITAAIFRSCSDASYRLHMRGPCDPLSLVLVNCFIGGLMLLPVTGVPDFSGVDARAVIWLCLANACWAAQTFFHIKSYQGMGLGMNAILDCSRYLLLIACGALIFGESIGLLAALGILALVAGILLGTPLDDLQTGPSFVYRLLSVASGTIAITLDKFLTTIVHQNVVTLAGFFIPSLIFCLAKPRLVIDAPKFLARDFWPSMISTALIAGTGYHLIHAFAAGDLGLSLTIYQSSVIISFLIGVVFLGERSRLARRFAGSLLCVLGILLSAY